MQVNHWTQIHAQRWQLESPGRNSDEDLTLVVYRVRDGRYQWTALDANDFATIERGYAATPHAAKSAALRFSQTGG